LPKVLHERGYLIPAINTDTIDYVGCAEQLASSIRKFHPNAHITILTQDQLPYGNLGGFANDWQCFYASPFRQTIKIEADMVVTGNIDHWWQGLAQKELVLTIGCRNFKNQLSPVRDYRKIFDANNLPDVYNAITYWRLSKTAKQFFDIVRTIFENWNNVCQEFKFAKEQPLNTDFAYAVAATIIGIENCTLPGMDYPSLIHMKPRINDTQDDWTQEMVWEITDHNTRINTIVQQWPIHYQIKSFAKEIDQIYGKLLESR
jgi:hypothetical protein